MADVAAVLDTAGLAGLQAGKKGHKKAGAGHDPAGFIVAMISQMTVADSAKGKSAVSDPGQTGLLVSTSGAAPLAGELIPEGRAERKERPALPGALPEAAVVQEAATRAQAQVDGRHGNDEADPVAEVDLMASGQMNAPVAALPIEAHAHLASAAVAVSDEGEAIPEAGVRAPAATPLARAVQTMAANLARDLPETAAVEREERIPLLPLDRIAEAGKGVQEVSRTAQSSSTPAIAADVAGKAGQVLPPMAGGMAQNDPRAFQGQLTDGGELFDPNFPATPSSGLSETTMVRPFEHVLRQVEMRLNASVDAPVRTPAFAPELGEKVVWLASRGAQIAELTLNPPQMGSLEVRLTVAGGEAGAQFFSPNPAVRDALEAALPKLRELMAQAGINLGDASVRDQAFTQDKSAGQPQVRAAAPFAGAEATEKGAQFGPHRSAGVGLVDLYA